MLRVPVCPCARVPVCPCARVPGAPVLRCSGAPVLRCSGAPVLRRVINASGLLTSFSDTKRPETLTYQAFDGKPGAGSAPKKHTCGPTGQPSSAGQGTMTR
jgi:hypothetical protein